MRFFAIASLVFTAATSVFAGPVAGRDNTPTSAVDILSALNENVKPVAAQLSEGLTSQTATPDAIISLVQEIIDDVTSAISDLQNLKSQSGGSFMGSSSASDVATPVGEILSDVLGAVGIILQSPDTEDLDGVTGLLAPLVDLLLQLLAGLIGLQLSDAPVSRVFALLETSISPVAWVITTLGLAPQYSSLLGYTVGN